MDRYFYVLKRVFRFRFILCALFASRFGWIGLIRSNSIQRNTHTHTHEDICGIRLATVVYYSRKKKIPNIYFTTLKKKKKEEKRKRDIKYAHVPSRWVFGIV